MASYLATPIFVVDAAGTLIYYNVPAEHLLGVRYDDTSEMSQDDWLAAFAPRNLDGTPLAARDNPLLAALAEQREQHRSLAIVSATGSERRIEATCVPLLGQARRLLGAVAIFWANDA